MSRVLRENKEAEDVAAFAKRIRWQQLVKPRQFLWNMIRMNAQIFESIFDNFDERLLKFNSFVSLNTIINPEDI